MNRITEITKRDILDLFQNGLEIDEFFQTRTVTYNYYGRLEEIDFLKRLYDLERMPSFDSRFANAEQDIWQHTVNNDDYPYCWVFEDKRFNLQDGSDEVYLKFLCEVFHPAVRYDKGYWKEFLVATNKLLQNDGYEIYPAEKISNRDVYGWRIYQQEDNTLFIPYSQRNAKDIKAKKIVLSIKRKARNQIYQFLERYNIVYQATDETGWNYNTTVAEDVFNEIRQFYVPKCYNDKKEYVETADLQAFILSNSPFCVLDAIEFFAKHSITLNDSNGVLSDYSFLSSDSNVSVSKSGNKLTISSTVAISGSVRITAKRNNVPTVSSSAKLIAYGDPNLQDLVTGVENADTVSAYINIETPTGTIALKKTSEDGVVEGISFTIKGDNFNKTVKTGKDGSVSVEGLFPGTYTVTEQSIDRYEPQKTQTVTLIGGKTSTVTFSNTLKRGSLEIVKTSEDNLVEEMKFHLYGTSLSGLPVDEYAVTDKNGLAKFENVLISGDTPYVVEEVDTAVRYVVPASQTAPIEWNKVTKRSFDNVLKKFQVTVTKTDAETGSPQGNASLAGAVYGIYKGEELIDTYTTDKNGQFTTKYYICDNDWTVREISPSEGYLLDTAIHKVGAEPELYTVELNSTANDVNEQVIKGNIALIKHTDNGETQIETPEEGAVFEVFLKSAGSYENAKETERDVLTCDENGFAQTKDMPYGIYTVRQTSGWEGCELMKDFDVFISKDGQTYRYLINNANFESYIKIVKKDAETGNTIPYAGAGFQIYDPNGNLVTMTFTYPEVTTIDTFYTTADGDLITPQTLEYGKGYSLVEVQAPYGYVLNSEPVYFDVVQENSEEESGITVIEVVRSNMAQKGTITVEKSGEVFSSVAGDKGLYQPIFSVSGLEGAVYEITAAEDIVTLDGTVRANKGEVVDTVTTGKDGTAKSKELYLGKYAVKEITAPYGMVLNEEVHSVELVYAGQNVDVTETATSFYNERQRVEIDLIKSLAIDDAYGIGKNGEIFDVTFGLYAAEELTAADGKTIPADGLIEVISLDESGHGKAISDLPMGSYYVQEISTNSAYIVSDVKYPVIFKYAGQDTEIVRITANEGEAITNELYYECGCRTGAFESRQLPCAVCQQVPKKHRAL